jgi:hypothetical protein
MSWNVIEKNHHGIRCLFIPVNGTYYRVEPAALDDWARLSQGVAALQRRRNGTATADDFSPHMKLGSQLTAMLALGPTLEEIRKERPGRRWIQEAALTATYWHLSGFEAARNYWETEVLNHGT